MIQSVWKTKGHGFYGSSEVGSRSLGSKYGLLHFLDICFGFLKGKGSSLQWPLQIQTQSSLVEFESAGLGKQQKKIIEQIN